MSNTQTTKNIKTGDKVYIACMGRWDTYYSVGTVTKVTPAGMVDVQIGDGEPMRFRPDGKLRGKGYHEQLDSLPFEERAALLAKEKRAQAAARAISQITVQGNVNSKWGVDGLTEELDRLQGLLDAARAAVAAVGITPEVK